MNKEVILSKINYHTFYNDFIPTLKINGRDEAKGLCPFHDDKNPSFSVNLESGLYHCFGCQAGGDVFDFYQRLKGVPFQTALQEIGHVVGLDGNSPRPKIVGIFKYYEEAGQVVYWKERIEPGRNGQKKEFLFYHIENGKKVSRRCGDPIPYKLPELVEGGGPIYFVEGEAKADFLNRWGFTATCLDSGADSPWRPEYLTYFQGKDVVLFPDKDEPGRSYAERIAGTLNGQVKSIKVVALPGLAEKGDILDWIKDPGNTKEKFLEIVKFSPTWKPQIKVESPTLRTPILWPSSLAEQTYHGLAGEFVKTIEPHTEADPVALLIQFLAGFGNVIGRGSWFEVEADKHYLNLFCALVGETSKGRKGVSHGQVKKVLSAIDLSWANNFKGGLSSGEGLIWAVRDPIYKKEKNKRTGQYEEVIVDGGVEDKRLLVVEEELASTLRVLERDGNTLSAIIRKAWDDGCLSSLTKNSPAKATGAHISIIGHITKDELRRYLTSTESGNGFANRFNWLCVRRSKILPEGGRAHELNLNPLIIRIKKAVDFGKIAGEIQKDEEAREIWASVYPGLSEGKPGLFGAVTSRAEAQVMRLACLYSVLDESRLIKKEHLFASLALWDFSEASARYIFGDATGDRVADQILEALRGSTEGMTRTEISGLFGRNRSSDRIDQALSILVQRGLVKKVKEQTPGRAKEWWVAL